MHEFLQAPLTWYLKEILIVGVYVPLLVYMLGFDIFGLGVFLSGAWARRAVVAFSAGAVLQSFSFCTLHDASHYGLWFKVLVCRCMCFECRVSMRWSFRLDAESPPDHPQCGGESVISVQSEMTPVLLE